MIDGIASFDGRMAKVQGPARSGKTEALVRRAAQLLRAGVDPASILVETTSSFAAQAFRQRLKAAADGNGAAAEAVAVLTPLEACALVLDAPAARAATGRVPRMLTPAEYNFFLEDMKTLGTPIRKLRRMLDYFYQQMAQLEPRENWRVGDQERAVLDLMESTLASREAMLAQEAPALAVDFLQSDAGKAARGSFAYVLCDYYQNMSRAQQTCLCLLAGTQLAVAGNPNQTLEVATDFPCPQGFAQFDGLREGVQTFSLTGAYGNPDVAAFVNALCDHGDMDPAFKASPDAEGADGRSAAGGCAGSGRAGAVDRFRAVKWTSPDDELNGLTKYLRALMNAQGDAHESRTCIVVPNRRWALMAQKVLRSRGFSVSAAGALSGLGGDPRESSRARALVAYTKLTLLALPRDLTAWRSWCGFDNHLTNSDAWANLAQFASEGGLSLYDALAAVGSRDKDEPEPFLRANVLAERWRAGQEFIAANAGRKGFSVLRAIGANGLPEFEDLDASIVGDEDACQLYRLMRASVTDPVWPENPHVLHVADFDALCGGDYDNVLVMGAVDGFVPGRGAFEAVSTDADRERVLNRDRRRFANAVSKAGGRLVVSYFSKADLELAERSKMQVTRVRAENGGRVAVVRPTCFLAEAGNAAPTTDGGQALLAELGLN